MLAEGYARLSPGAVSFKALIGKSRLGGNLERQRKPRAPHTYKLSEPAQCAADGCNAPFDKRLPHQRFCSALCRNRVNNVAGWTRRRVSEPRLCALCGKSFIPPYGGGRIKYCSLECGTSAKRKLRSGSTNRRRAAKFGVVYEPVNKRKVFERDGWKCYLCGVPTPAILSGTKEPNAPELEHVVPLAMGGAHSYSNVRCACHRCNRAKGASIPEQI